MSNFNKRIDKIVLIFCKIALLFLSASLHGQVSSNYKSLSGYIRYWGLLKYTHPAITEGKINWDAVFLQHINVAIQVTNEKELNALYLQMMQECDSVKVPKAFAKPAEHVIVFNPVNYNIYGVDSTLSKKLEWLVNLPKKRQFYLQRKWGDGVLTPINENDTLTSITPEKELRWLALARFWNYMNYFYPYKNKLPVDWNDVLYEYTVKLAECDKGEYYPVMMALTSEIRDTHYGFRTKDFYNRFGNYYCPFYTSILQDTVVVIWIDPTDSLANKKLKVGDIILGADGVSVDSLIAFYKEHVRKANPTAVNRDLNYYLFRGNTNSVQLTLLREHVQDNVVLHRNQGYNRSKNYGDYPIIDTAIYKVNDTTLYLRPFEVDAKDIKHALKNIMIRKVIVDLRVVTKNNDGIDALLRYVNKSRTMFSTTYYESYNTPGTFKRNNHYNRASNKANPYHLIIVVDEYTQSASEFVCMKFQCVPNSETVGTQTAGALGGVIKVRLPGGISILFTGSGCSYPNGDFIYPNGVKIDHIVNRTVAGIKHGKDELMLKAIEK